MSLPNKKSSIRKLLDQGKKLNFALEHYPSRGQTAIQELYQTKKGKLFLKQTSEANLRNCRIDPISGTLAERELWCTNLAIRLGLTVPNLILLDQHTTVQEWLDLPDANQFTTHEGRLILDTHNVFDCAIFDWATGQADRHDANYLYDYVRKKIILIDSAHSLLKHSGSIPDYLRVFEIGYQRELCQKIRSDVYERMLHLTSKELRKLIQLRNKEEWEAFALRIQALNKVRTLNDILNLYRQK